MGDRRALQLTEWSFCLSRKKCRVKVSFYFFAIACAAAFFDRSGVMLWGMLAALLHECGHVAVMAAIPGQLPREVSLTPFGVKIEKSPLSEYGSGHLAVLGAGSCVNLITAAVTFGFLPTFASVSFLLGVMNLLPVEGMDGGGILRSVLGKFRKGRSADRAGRIISWGTLVGMTILGIYVLVSTGRNFTLLAMAAALAFRGRRTEKARKFVI
jgi:Zn-dependent proteases